MDKTPSWNSQAKLEIHVQLSCESGFYGPACGKRCQAKAGHSYCDSQGNAVCVKGKLPPDCQNDDPCLLNPCAEGAECKNLEDGGRQCICEAEDTSKCYGYKACEPNPCLNGGECTLSSTNRFKHDCLCPMGFAGANCAVPWHWITIASVSLITIITCALVVICRCRRKTAKEKAVYKLTKNQLEFKEELERAIALRASRPEAEDYMDIYDDYEGEKPETEYFSYEYTDVPSLLAAKTAIEYDLPVPPTPPA
ncbi:hypothetical protein Ciccas_002803 [Cichlidogyrus casuarinus]|uniref:EGF-like domain-containing protein n=1 Tax=Cichlidogyrus casuarinus TaxID=1844966 RepID=A0ABD2QG62_9PLAT